MPAGPEGLGFAYFIAAKYAGYTTFCRYAIQPRLSTRLDGDEEFAKPPMSAFAAGAIRTGIGIAVGAAVGFGFWSIPSVSRTSESVGMLLFFSLLIPVRVGEWWLLMRLAYKSSIQPAKHPLLLTSGILTSFALDAIAFFTAMALPGGMWVC